jgi:hypothetical protein
MYAPTRLQHDAVMRRILVPLAVVIAAAALPGAAQTAVGVRSDPAAGSNLV